MKRKAAPPRAEPPSAEGAGPSPLLAGGEEALSAPHAWTLQSSVVIMSRIRGDGAAPGVAPPIPGMPSLPEIATSAELGRFGITQTGRLTAPDPGQDTVILALTSALLPALGQAYFASPQFVAQLLKAFQTHVLATYGTTPVAQAAPGGLSQKQTLRAQAYLTGQPLQRLSIEEIAAACGLSRSHFSKAFKVTTGQSPHQWVMQYRLAQVLAMLRGEKPMADIARECGFADQGHMSRTFRREMGLSPSAWRRQQS